MTKTISRSALPLFALLAFSGCSDLVTNSSEPEVAQAPPSGVVLSSDAFAQLVLEEHPGPDVGTYEYRVLLNHSDSEVVAAYQGALTFPGNRFRVISVSAPASADGEFRIVNSEEAAGGVIRFAGFAPERFESNLVLTIIVSGSRAPLPSELSATLDVVGNADGAAFPVEGLQPSEGIRNPDGSAIERW
jgi:hypothetical protein